MNVRLKVGILTILVVLVAYIISPIPFTAADSDSSSTIGRVKVSGLTEEEMKTALLEAVGEWQSAPLTVTGDGWVVELDPAQVVFDIDASIASYEQQAKKPWFAFWQKERSVQLPLIIESDGDWQERIREVGAWAFDATYYNVRNAASYLSKTALEAEVVTVDTANFDRIALEMQPVPVTAVGVEAIMARLNNYTVHEGQVFSYIEALEETMDEANNDAHNFVASMLYSVALKMNSEIFERTSQNVVPPYLEPGIEAVVNRNRSQDLQFLNTTSNAVELRLSFDYDQLKVEAFGISDEVAGIQVVRDADVAPRVIERYSKNLSPGDELVMTEGQAGMRVTVLRFSSTSPEGEVMSKDFYPPVHRVVLKSAQQPVTTPTEPSNPPSNPPSHNSGALTNKPKEPGEEGFPPLPKDEKDLPKGSYYDKGGNLVTP